MDQLEQDLAKRLHSYVYELKHEPAEILAQTVRLMIDRALLDFQIEIAGRLGFVVPRTTDDKFAARSDARNGALRERRADPDGCKGLQGCGRRDRAAAEGAEYPPSPLVLDSTVRSHPPRLVFARSGSDGVA